MADEDREDMLYHGTTWEVAQVILATRKFEYRETYFAATRELAEFFARRSSSRRPGQAPAIVRIALYHADVEVWRKNRLVQSKGFDEGDQPSLTGKTQLIFSAEEMKFLNRDMFSADLAIEPVDIK
jgi:hypothetical protein